MPGGDGTGPGGMGPMTGRAAGYCAGYSEPGFISLVTQRGSKNGAGKGRGMPGGGGRNRNTKACPSGGVGRGRGGGRGKGRNR